MTVPFSPLPKFPKLQVHSGIRWTFGPSCCGRAERGRKFVKKKEEEEGAEESFHHKVSNI